MLSPIVFERVKLNKTAHIASLALVAAVYFSMFMQQAGKFDGLTMAVLLLLGALFLFLCIFGVAFCEWQASLSISLAYFVIQIPLALVIFYLSGGAGFSSLLPLVLVSHAVAIVPRPFVIGVGTVVTLGVTLIIWNGSELDVALPGIFSVLAGVIFVAGFTQIATSEEEARKQVESLVVELEQANHKLREYAVQVEELATTEERNRVAREIHDGLGHYLTALNIQLEAAKAVLDIDPERGYDALDKAQQLAQEALADVRRSVSALRAAPTGEKPLRELLTELVAQNYASGIVTELFVSGMPRSLPPNVELTLYRVTQEALTNIRKHSRATKAIVHLDYTKRGHNIQLQIVDNGFGNASVPEEGFGLVGLSERIQHLGGQMEIETSPGEGFCLTVDVPA
ncbi:MAG: sensor histidine kinase [Anaerolineae bacterium]|nr:sensor histidine kinase [Anaerolineae bacterium]